MVAAPTNVDFTRLKTPGSKCRAGYQPAAALWAAFVFNTASLLKTGCRLNSPPYKHAVAVFTQPVTQQTFAKFLSKLRYLNWD
jgi:hypothetical protein